MIKWVFVCISIICTTIRAFNWGYQSQLYLLSSVAYMYFAITANEETQRILNGFYLLVALLGAYRWWG